MNELLKLSQAKQALAEAKSLDEIKAIKDIAKAAIVWAKAQGMSKDIVKDGHDIERAAAIKLAQALKQAQADGELQRPEEGKASSKMELGDIGVTKKESHVNKTLEQAGELLDMVVEALEDKGKEASLNAVYNEIKKAEKKEDFENRKQAFSDDEQPGDKDNITIIHGNSTDILPTVEAEFDLLVTDPPYGMEYQSNMREDKLKIIENDSIKDTTYIIDQVLREAVKLLKDDAHFYIFGNIRLLEWVKPAIQKHLQIKDILIWDRMSTSMGDLASYAPSYDIIYFGYNIQYKPLNGLRDTNILKFRRVESAELQHPTEKPIELLKYIIKKSSNEGDSVLDPFAGGGSTLLAARDVNRNALGIEMDQEYVNLIKSRL